jgi:hypothetical protein
MFEKLKRQLGPVAILWVCLLLAGMALHKYNQAHPIEALDKQATFVGTVTAVQPGQVTVTADDPDALGAKAVVFDPSDTRRAPEVEPGDKVQIKCQFKSKVTEPQGVRLVEMLLLGE